MDCESEYGSAFFQLEDVILNYDVLKFLQFILDKNFYSFAFMEHILSAACTKREKQQRFWCPQKPIIFFSVHESTFSSIGCFRVRLW